MKKRNALDVLGFCGLVIGIAFGAVLVAKMLFFVFFGGD